MNHLKTFFLLVLAGAFLEAAAQVKQTYGPGFEFAEGVYVTFSQFKANKPIPKNRIISREDKTEVGFLGDMVSKNKISIRMDKDSTLEIRTNRLWGYSENNSVYINFQGNFSKIPVIGSACHFTAVVVTDHSVYDPYRYDRGRNVVRSLEQYILDMEDGKVFAFNTRGIEYILTKDPELAAEFAGLSKRKKKKSLFIYLRKYNGRHPLQLGS